MMPSKSCSYQTKEHIVYIIYVIHDYLYISVKDVCLYVGQYVENVKHANNMPKTIQIWNVDVFERYLQ